MKLVQEPRLEQEINSRHKTGIIDYLCSDRGVKEKAVEIEDSGNYFFPVVHDAKANKPIRGHREGEHE